MFKERYIVVTGKTQKVKRALRAFKKKINLLRQQKKLKKKIETKNKYYDKTQSSIIKALVYHFNQRSRAQYIQL